jgi:hypothetical protein
MRRVSQSDFPKTIRLLPERISDRPVSPWCTQKQDTYTRQTNEQVGLYNRFQARLDGWYRVKHIVLCIQLGDHELASGDWREGEVLFPL